jgi:hypothetical protein
MKSIINLFWQICLLRQSPAYVPTYGWFVTLVVAANVLTSVVVTATVEPGFPLIRALTSILVAQTVTALLVFLALSLKNLAPRFVATVTALFGCDLLITACLGVVLPVGAMLGELAMSLTFLAYLIWSVAVAGFILQQALAVQLPMGIGIALGISLVSATFSQLAVGGAA